MKEKIILHLWKIQKKETIIDLLKDVRKQNPEELIFLLIDNFSSHKADVVKELVKELNIELCYLLLYSPQLQPIEKVWYKLKEITYIIKLTI